MIATKSKSEFSCDPAYKDSVLQLVQALNGGLKVVVPSAEVLQGKALNALLNDLAEHNDERSKLESCLQAWFGKDFEGMGVRLVSEGTYSFSGGFVVATGTARVEMRDVGIVLALGSSTVFARGRVTVFGCDHSRLNLYDTTVARATGNALVRSYDFSSGLAEGHAAGTARNRAYWKLLGEAHFDTYDNVVVRLGGASRLRAYGSTRTYGRDRTQAQLYDGSLGWFGGQAQIELFGESTVYALPGTSIRQVSPSAKQLPVVHDHNLVLALRG
jgi:hypothetical protein